MALQIVKDGQLQGWATATALTAITFFLLILGFLFDSITSAWAKMGDQYRAIYLGSLGIFFGSRVLGPGVQAVVKMISNRMNNPAPQRETPDVGDI